ncbi:hypothetical protein BC936DRAFT_142872 [Jimgerdemannia flammicorona]|uniref:Uncharacterized protein n=1 Tax=Jimgerdemannia flammicorona TaxID=994334 RepID=A0A433DEN6_9FUNG|nr:hypothetical protein BC936DRAFT_142872 [Jimgerdemannia flammicorona]
MIISHVRTPRNIPAICAKSVTERILNDEQRNILRSTYKESVVGGDGFVGLRMEPRMRQYVDGAEHPL